MIGLIKEQIEIRMQTKGESPLSCMKPVSLMQTDWYKGLGLDQCVETFKIASLSAKHVFHKRKLLKMKLI